jgi:hypothetical protein
MKAARRPQGGATLVEFVVIFPLAALFVLGLIQAGLVYMAKIQLNHATFMAARVGALNNADYGTVHEAMIRGLNPFYEKADTTNDLVRISGGYFKTRQQIEVLFKDPLDVTILNPSDAAFDDFGLYDPAKNVTYIPNDNLEWRSGRGGSSNLELRDANLLKLKVVYGYELKVPLMAGVLRRMMCGGTIGVVAWGNVSASEAIAGNTSDDCIRFYRRGRIPIESFAIVEMQSRAERRN